MRARQAFTLIELLVVITIIMLLSTVLMPSVGRARELAKRTVCGSNLRVIGSAFALYKHEHGDSYPWIANRTGMRFDAPMKAGGADNPYQLVGSSSTDLNILENLNLLVVGNMAVYKVFRCPSVSGQVIDRLATTGNHLWGFRDAGSRPGPFIDYALQIGYTSLSTAPDVPNPAALNDALDQSVVIMADAPAGASNVAMISTSDFYVGANRAGYAHRTDGVNVLYASGGVGWSDRTVRAGWGRNNIYLQDVDCSYAGGLEINTVNAAKPGGNTITYTPTSSSSKYDSILYWGY